MFYSITGKIVHIDPTFLAVDCGGVAYKLYTTMNSISRVGGIGETATLFTHTVIREDTFDIYGFVEQSELNCFRMLTSVSGVGPKVAQGILSGMTPEKFALSVASEDVQALRSAPGIGPKIAQRIVLELRDRVKKIMGTDDMPAMVSSGVMNGDGSLSEALNALMVLGYSHGEAASALSKLDVSLPVEDMIKKGLKTLAEK